MIFFVNDTRKIDEKEFKDFHWELVYIGLNLLTGVPEARVRIWENLFEHERTLNFTAPESYNEKTLVAECISQLMVMPEFEKSIEVKE